MKGPQESRLPPGTLSITSEAQAAVVTNRLELRRLAPFMRGECTVSQAAAELGLTVTAMFKLTQRYLKLGLLRETRREKRAGRAIRYYSAARAFFVPFSLRSLEHIGKANRAAQLEVFEANLSRAIREHFGSDWGTLTSFLPSGETYYELVSPQGEMLDLLADHTPRILSGWNRLVLTRKEAQQLQKQLLDLLAPYLNRKSPGDTYQLGVFMARDRSSEIKGSDP